MTGIAPHGLHHVTAIAGDPQRNADFYTRVLGLRLVKRTVNFDAPDTYHLYSGDEQGTPGSIVEGRTWNEYSIGRATTQEHLGALDLVYRGVIEETRATVEEVEELDPVTEDMLIGHLEKLELFHWFIRAHLENAGGELATADAGSEAEAAAAGASTEHDH